MEGREIQITNVLEIRLAGSHWNSIKIAACLKYKTYSNITRYCTLRLARKGALQWTRRIRGAYDRVGRVTKAAPDHKRHMMCLYGEDEKLIRLAAMDMGLTMTAFVRLAIELYLPMLGRAMENRSRRYASDHQLKTDGIRFVEKLQIFALNGAGWPLLREITCIPFEPESYW